MKNPSAFIEIPDLTLHSGEVLTVWLCKDKNVNSIQVELHIKPDGTPEIFCDELKTKNFKEYDYKWHKENQEAGK